MTLKIAYIILTLVTNLFLITIGFRAINKTIANSKKSKLLLVFSLLLWQIFIYTLASTDILLTYSFSPLFAIAFIIPSFVFTGLFLYWNRNKQWILNIPEHWIVYFQSFRIFIETLFVLSLAKCVFNPEVTIEGYNFDMVFGLTAPIVAYLAYNRKKISKRIVVLWNYLGLAVLTSVIMLFMISIYAPGVFGSNSPILPMKSMTYPYVLIAGFLMPVAVFLHVLSIIQINKGSLK